MYKHLGSRTVYRQSYDVADCYEKLAGADEACADILYQAGQYNQGAYFLLQAMEKYVKSRICRRIDVLNPITPTYCAGQAIRWKSLSICWSR